jgi:hypothetical protein
MPYILEEHDWSFDTEPQSVPVDVLSTLDLKVNPEVSEKLNDIKRR